MKRIANVVLKVMIAFILVNLVAYLWLSLTSSEKVLDENINRQMHISKSQEASKSVWSLDVENAGDYVITAKWEADAEQLLMGFKLVDAEGKSLSYCTGAVSLDVEMEPIHLEAGEYKLILKYMCNAEQIEEFFEGTDYSEDWHEDWEPCTADPNVKAEIQITKSGLTEIQTGYFLGAFLLSAIVCILAAFVIGLDKKSEDAMDAKKSYAQAGLAMAAFGCIVTALQMVYPYLLINLFGEEIVNASWYSWMQIIVPTYLFGTTVAFLLSRSKDNTPIEKHKMSVGQFICCVFMNTAICGVGAIIGAIVNMLCLVPFGAENTNALAEIMTNSHPFWRILTVGIGAPVFEELILRKFLIDRIHKYGEGIAIVVSGLLFGLFHGNFSQVFFAAGLGFFFAYIYLRTGKVWYTIAFHMIINMTSAAITLPIVESLDFEVINKISTMDPMAAETQALTMQILPGILLLLGLYAVLGIFALVGIVLWIVMRKKFYLKKSVEHVETKKMRTAFGNFGMVAFLVLCILLFLQFYLGMIMMA